MAFELSYGTFESSVDEKGRVVIPAPLRERYKGELVVTQGSPHCVMIMLPEVWEKFQNNILKNKKKLSPSKFRVLELLYLYPMRVTEFDKNTGRIFIAPAVRNHAKLSSKKCLVMNANDHLEVWDAQYYYDYLDGKVDDIDEAADTLGTGLFDFDSENNTETAGEKA